MKKIILLITFFISAQNLFAQSWVLTGNNTTSGFLGTTNNSDLLFKRNAALAGRIGLTNLAFGTGSFLVNTIGTGNTALGSNALAANSSGSNGTANGTKALYINTTGTENTAVGYNSLSINTTGNYNTAIGSYSLSSNGTAEGNTSIGYLSGEQNSTGIYNSFLGTYAGYNSFFGFTNTNYSTAIGYKSRVDQDNSVIIGSVYNPSYGIQQARVGVGTTAPAYLFTAITNDPADNTSIYALSNINNGNGIISECNAGTSAYGLWGKSTVGFAGYFNGSVTITGVLTNPSDEKLKENILPLNNALQKISELKPVTYNFKTEYAKMNLPVGTQNGFIAQEVGNILPELVVTNFDKSMDEKNPMEYKSINYIGMIPILTEAIKEQQTQIENRDSIILQQQIQIDALMNKMNQFENALSQCCSSYQSTQLETTNPKPETASLEQNVPNPFNQSSFIKYFAPSSSKQIVIEVSELNGRVVKTFSNLNNGFGTVNISAGTFAAGTYQYTLFIDGNKIDTKQIVIIK